MKRLTPLPLFVLLACGGDGGTEPPRPGTLAVTVSYDFATETGRLQADGQKLIGPISCTGDDFGSTNGASIDRTVSFPVNRDPYEIQSACSATGEDGEMVSDSDTATVPGFSMQVTYDLTTETGHLEAAGGALEGITCQGLFGHVSGVTIDETRGFAVVSEAYPFGADCTATASEGRLTRSDSAWVPANEPPTVSVGLDSAQYAVGSLAHVIATVDEPDSDGPLDSIETCVLTSAGSEVPDDTAPYTWDVEIVENGQAIDVTCWDTRGGSAGVSTSVAAYQVYNAQAHSASSSFVDGVVRQLGG